MTKDEALTLEALKYAASKGYGRIVRENSDPFTIKAALPQPEPVTEREALKLALITLEGWDNHDKWVWPETALEQAKRNTKEAITAIKEALAQPAQEQWNEDGWRKINWRCRHGWLRGEQCEICNAAQPAQEPVAMRMPKVGDKVICLEDESLGTIVSLTAGGSPDIKFDDGSHGTYLLREFAELFCYASTPQPAQEALYGMNQDDWKDVVAAIAKVRDGRGIYLGCRPVDVFQDWFLALGTAKVKEKNG